jgi:hypothetical protein
MFILAIAGMLVASSAVLVVAGAVAAPKVQGTTLDKNVYANVYNLRPYRH